VCIGDISLALKFAPTRPRYIYRLAVTSVTDSFVLPLLQAPATAVRSVGKTDIYLLELKPIAVAIQWALVRTYTGLMNHWSDKRCPKLNLVNL